MTRPSSLIERPVLRLLMLVLMGLALASRLALGAALPSAHSGAGPNAADTLSQLRAAMIMCHTGHDQKPAPTMPQEPLPSDLLLFDQADNAHALASAAVVAPRASRWSRVVFQPMHSACLPPLRRPVRRARSPPPAV